MKAETIDLKGKAYATVPTRIKLFREECPNGLIETTPEFKETDVVVFKARILKDKSNLSSGESTGHSIGKVTGEKSFEKLETIAIGRALAILGYMASGDIASSEEMEEFNEYQAEQMELIKQEIEAIKDMESLKVYYNQNKGKGKEFDALIKIQKDIIKSNQAK
jgi:hypothetical protein